MEKVRLGDVCEKASSNIAQKDLENSNGIFPIYGASGFIKNIDFYKQEKEYIAVVKDGAGVGKVLKCPAKSSVIGTLQYILPKENIDMDFLAFAMENMHLSKYYTGATIPHIYFKDYCKESFFLPALDEQKKIANILNTITELIDKRKKQLEKLDELVKSRFIELFGDGCDGRFPMKTLPEIITSDKHALKRGPFGGALKKEDFVENGYLVYEQRHAIHSDFDYEKYHITPEKYKDMIMFKVVPGDLIISCSGVTLGRIAEIPSHAKEGIINQALLKVSLDQSIMTNTFFIHQFRGGRVQDILFGFCRGSGIPNFPSMNEVKAVKFICPPIDLQNQFAAFVEQTDKSKSAVKNGLEKLELLKNALMQKYFG